MVFTFTAGHIQVYYFIMHSILYDSGNSRYINIQHCSIEHYESISKSYEFVMFVRKVQVDDDTI